MQGAGGQQGPVPAGPYSAPTRQPETTKPEIPVSELAQAPVCENSFELPNSLSVLNELSIPVWVVDFEVPRILWGNRSTCYYFGKELDQLVGMDLLKGRSAARAALEDEMFQTVQVKRGTQHTRKSFHPDSMPSVTFDLELRPVNLQLPGEKEPRTVALNWGYPVLDSSVHNESTRAMEMLRYSDILMMLFQETGELLNSNVQARSFYFGATAGTDGQEGPPRVKGREITLRDVLDTCVWDGLETTQQSVWEQVCQLKAGDNPIVIECRKADQRTEARCTSGGTTEIIHSIKFIPTYDPVSGTRCLLVNETDVSELSSARAEQRALLAETKVKEKFLTAVSHELRTPLNGIIGLSDSLLNDPNVGSSVRRLIQVIRSSGQQLNVLVGDLIDTAAMSNKTFLISTADVNLADMVASTVGVTGPLIKKGVELENEVEEGLPTIRGDAGRIQQALISVLGNSAKFTQVGKVRVSGKHHPESNEVCLQISDTGIGIDEETIKSIFSTFTQADMSTTRSHGGVGLGLALVKNIMHAHGGTISVVSSTMPEDHGTCFSLTFPLDRKDFLETQSIGGTLSGGLSDEGVDATVEQLKQRLEKAVLERNNFLHLLKKERLKTERLTTVVSSPSIQAARASLSESEAPKQESATPPRPFYSEQNGGVGEIICVDDDPLNRLLVEQILELAGYVVVSCSGADQALKLIRSRSHLPDVILMDRHMPDKDGCECVRQLRQTEDQCLIPVICLSANHSHEMVKEGIEEGCSDFLFKPFQRHELLARVVSQMILTKKQQSTTSAAIAPPPMAGPQGSQASKGKSHPAVKESKDGDLVLTDTWLKGHQVSSSPSQVLSLPPPHHDQHPSPFLKVHQQSPGPMPPEGLSLPAPSFTYGASPISASQSSPMEQLGVLLSGRRRGTPQSSERDWHGRDSPSGGAHSPYSPPTRRVRHSKNGSSAGMSPPLGRKSRFAPDANSSPVSSSIHAQSLSLEIDSIRQGVLDLVRNALKRKEDAGEADLDNIKTHDLGQSVLSQSQKAHDLAVRYEMEFPKVATELDATKAELSTALLNLVNKQFDHERAMASVETQHRQSRKEMADLRDANGAQKMQIEYLEKRANRINDELDTSIEEQDGMRQEVLTLSHKLAVEEREKDNLLRDIKVASAATAARRPKGESSPKSLSRQDFPQSPKGGSTAAGRAWDPASPAGSGVFFRQ